MTNEIFRVAIVTEYASNTTKKLSIIIIIYQPVSIYIWRYKNSIPIVLISVSNGPPRSLKLTSETLSLLSLLSISLSMLAMILQHDMFKIQVKFTM